MFINHRKKILALSFTLLLGTFFMLSFTNSKQPEPKKLKNLKVFPVNATYREVDHVMDQFKVDLGVKCSYCHAPSKENPKKLDMASDENPKKDITRDMMRMTAEMNKKYIANIPHADSVKVQLITCNTCHRGAAKPFGTSNLPTIKQQDTKASQLPPPPPRN